MNMKLTAMLFLALFASSTFAETKSDSTTSSTLFNIKTEIKELKNRTLEATVRGHKVLIDQPKTFGADDLAPTPPELLAISYGSCIISTMQFVAMQRGLKIQNITVVVEGTIDFSKAMGLQTKNRAGINGLKTKIAFKSTITELEKKKFLSDIFFVGAAIDNIQNGTPVAYEILDAK